MSHHIERCACGSVLKHVAEKEAGMCVSCMIAIGEDWDMVSMVTRCILHDNHIIPQPPVCEPDFGNDSIV